MTKLGEIVMRDMRGVGSVYVYWWQQFSGWASRQAAEYKRARAYHGGHRAGDTRTPYVDRFRAWLDAQPSAKPEPPRPAWDTDTMSMFLPDFVDDEAQKITYGRGHSHYPELSTVALDEEARRLIEPVFTRTEMQFADVDDELYAEVML